MSRLIALAGSPRLRVAVVLALVLGGSLDGWASHRVQWWPLAVLAMVIQLVLYSPPFDAWPLMVAAGPLLGLGTMFAVVVMLLRNANGRTRVAQVLAEHGVPAKQLCVEITESTFMADQARAHAVLGALREMGVRVAIDDFPTGYSSLAYLKSLPTDEVKIDRSFVHDLATDRDDAAIVRAIIGLSHDLGLDVTAEGVEDAETMRRLQEFGCDETQDYFLSLRYLQRVDDPTKTRASRGG
jgi:predicted signal transduction protein with EAL and GGDEF domain